MAHAYTPGLKVTAATTVTRRRLLPIPGEVVVSVGDAVKADQVVARTELPGEVRVVNAINQLGISAAELPSFALVKAGDSVEADAPLAESKPLFKFLRFMKTIVRSPIKGMVREVSDVTGQILLSEPPLPLEVSAYVDGRVREVIEGQGIEVETNAAMVQGIFGVGGEGLGELALATKGPEEVLEGTSIGPEHRGKVVAGGALMTMEAVEAAKKNGVACLVSGGIHDGDLRKLLGYDIGVAITGTEEIGLTLVVTEGFGKIPMAPRTFELLQSLEGRRASFSGATQIRAGVIRPEVMVALEADAEGAAAGEPAGIDVGSTIRVIREPWFGKIGRVAALPHEPVSIDTESKVRILTVDFGDGKPVTVPRANVEMIEDR